MTTRPAASMVPLMGAEADDVAGDLAAIDESFGVLLPEAGEELHFDRGPDDRWTYLERAADP